MKIAIVEIEGIAPISFSAQHSTPKMEGEAHDAYDKRTWRERAHAHDDGRCYVPGITLAKALVSTAMQLGEKIPGRGAKRWGSVFKSGLMCPDPIDLMQPAPVKVVASSSAPAGGRAVPVMKDDIEHVDVYCHAEPAKGGSGGRVWRRFPIVHKWSGVATIYVVNDEITEKVLRRHLDMCGQINGMGRWRPQTGGQFGRFKVTAFEWQDEAKVRAA